MELSANNLAPPVPALLDAMLELYVEWREHAGAARAAYARWCDAPSPEAVVRFGAYQAALDQEESAARWYAAIVRDLARCLR